MSSEKRLVRPYVGLEPFQAILDTWFVKIADQLLEPGERRTISASSFTSDPAILVCAVDDDALVDVRKEAVSATEALGFEPTDVELVVVAATPYLRMADIAYQQSLAHHDAVPRSLNLATDCEGLRSLLTPSGGCDLDVYFCLARDRPHVPLRPTRRGTWLGHVHFGLRTELGELGFTPRSLTAAVRTELDLPTGTIRHVAVEAEALLADDLAGAVDLYVDEDILAVLNQSPGTPAAKSFQRQIFIDVMGAIVRATLSSRMLNDLQLTDLEETVLGRIVWAAAGPGLRGETSAQLTARREQAFGYLKVKPEHFMALIESSCAPRDDWRHTIGGLDE